MAGRAGRGRPGRGGRPRRRRHRDGKPGGRGFGAPHRAVADDDGEVGGLGDRGQGVAAGGPQGVSSARRHRPGRRRAGVDAAGRRPRPAPWAARVSRPAAIAQPQRERPRGGRRSARRTGRRPRTAVQHRPPRPGGGGPPARPAPSPGHRAPPGWAGPAGGFRPGSGRACWWVRPDIRVGLVLEADRSTSNSTSVPRRARLASG